jgi:hypothetical protein
MVLNAGRIVEFDKPGVLLADSHSQFYALCKAAGREDFSALLRLSNASTYYSTSSTIRGSHPHTPGPSTPKHPYTTADASDASWKDAEAELEQDSSTSAPEVIERDPEAHQRYGETPSATPVQRASAKETNDDDDSSSSSSSEDGDNRQASTLPEVVVEEPKVKYDGGDEDKRSCVQEGSSRHDERHNDEAGYVLARKEDGDSDDST